MRILYVSTQYLPVHGGAERHCAQVAEGAVRYGHQATVYTSRLVRRDSGENQLRVAETINGVRIKRFSALKHSKFLWRVFSRVEQVNEKRRSYLLEVIMTAMIGPFCPFLGLNLVFHRGAYDFLHLFGIYSAVHLQTMLAAIISGIPYIVTPMIHTDVEQPIKWRWQKTLLRRASYLAAFTEHERGYLNLELGIPLDRITIAPPSINPASFGKGEQSEARRQLKIPQDSFVLLFIGRKEKNKGIKELLQAWYIINERGYAQAYLLMLGPSTRLWHQLRAAGIPAEERFSDLGEVSEDIKALALEACDCLILPSKGESFGIVIQEAWASKRAVVVSTLGSTSTIVSHGIDGLLFEIGSSESIADSCVRLIEQPRMAREMGRRGFDKVMNRYSTPVVEKDIMEMYSRISMKFGGGG